MNGLGAVQRHRSERYTHAAAAVGSRSVWFSPGLSTGCCEWTHEAQAQQCVNTALAVW